MLAETTEIFRQGAEGRIYIGEYKGEKCVIKERFPKKYRHPDLDAQITRQRMKAEFKTAVRCQNAGILVPKMLKMELNERRIYMEYFENAITVKEYIHKTIANAHNSTNKQSKAEEVIIDKLALLCERIGIIIGKMHANNIIHGDMTTSNILINSQVDIYTNISTTHRSNNNRNQSGHEPTDQIGVSNQEDDQVIFIDFGLSHYNQDVEDKGVDLYVLERALLSTHSEQPYLFEKILEAYRKTCGKDESAVVAKFEEVRLRGRKRTMLG